MVIGVHKNARPFWWEGQKKTICLLIHGFTGSPAEMRPLAEFLSKKGYGVSCPLLPGHGTKPEDLVDKTWHDWYNVVEEEYLRLRRMYPERVVIPVGLSMGGSLCLHLAANYETVGIVTLSAPIFVKRKKAYFVWLLQYLYSFERKSVTKEQWQKDFENGRFYYNKMPVKAVKSLLQLCRKVKKELGMIKAPALVLHSMNDRTADRRSAVYIYRKLGSKEKELVWLQEGGHVITVGPEREEVFMRVENFVKQITK